MKHRIHFLFASIFLVLFLNTAQAANIVASLDRNQIFLDESFRLIFQADDSVDDDPDFNPLRKNFEILNQSQSTNLSFVNGRYSRKGIWSLDLMAKKAGSFTIPSISFGKDQSPALRIKINDPSTAKKQVTKNKDVFLQLEIEEDEAWVQSQVVLKVRLFSRISMNNLRSSEPETNDPDAIIKQLGNASSFEAFRDGVRYAVHELRYAVFPQHSGKLTFKPIIFEGRISRARSQSFIDQFMNTGERKRVRSGIISIDVQPRPSNIKQSDWLPAKSIRLSEEWSEEDLSQLNNGEPVTRTITITADGMMAENLPDLKMAEINGLKQYPDKAAIENKVTNQGISSVKQIKVALIPTRSGDFKLPAIKLPWWNTKTGKMEVARLPEKLISAHGQAAAPVAPEIISSQTDENKSNPITLDEATQIARASYWPWLSLFLGGGWLITLIALFRKKPVITSTTSKAKVDLTSLRTLEKTVLKHCNNNDASQTKDALLTWAKARWPELNISNLATICPNVSTDLSAEIKALNTALYSAEASQWQANLLIKAFKDFRQNKPEHNKQIKTQQLEPLYK